MAVNVSGDFGRKLRDARERKGVSLRQIAGATKISIAALEALERNDISRLPGGIFSRAFVRSYAIEVGLDPEATIRDFIAQFPSDAVTAGHPATDRVEDEQAVESDQRTASTLLRLVMLSVPIVAVVLYFSTAGRRFVERAEEAVVQRDGTVPSAAPAVAPPEPQPVAAAPPVATPEPADRSRLAPSAVSAAGAVADRLTVGLSFTRQCWVSATVDGRRAIERVLQPGDSQTLEVASELVLTAGDASAVAMTLNGSETKPLGKSGEVVTRRVNLTNFKDYLIPR